MTKISLTVETVGIYKLNRLAPYFEINSTTINKILEIDYIRKTITKILYAKEFKQIIKIKKIAKKYGLPVTWAIVPFEHGIHSKEKRFDYSCPEMYNLLKRYAKKGDEIIQNGTFCTNDEFGSMSYKNQKERLGIGWQAIKEMFPNSKKIIHIHRYNANEETIKALSDMGYESVLAGNLIKCDIRPLKTTRQVILKKAVLNGDFFGDVPLNLVISPDKQNIKELEKWLKFSKDFQGDCEYMKTSECLI